MILTVFIIIQIIIDVFLIYIIFLHKKKLLFNIKIILNGINYFFNEIKDIKKNMDINDKLIDVLIKDVYKNK